MEAKTGVMQVQVEGHQRRLASPEATKGKGRIVTETVGCNMILDFRTPELGENAFLLFQSSPFVALCYVSPRKLTVPDSR